MSFVDAATKMAAFAALTNQRLLLIHTRIGAFKPLLENHGALSLAYPEINGVLVRSSIMIEQRKRADSRVPTQYAVESDLHAEGVFSANGDDVPVE